MANPEFFRSAFDKLAVGGFIGDPVGQPAYCYMRVSTSGQAEEGKTGLPRQIENIHKIASLKGYRVTWEMIFADDSSGFQWEGRPQLTILLDEIKRKKRRANAVVIEQLDRLSRNADWHQGYLLERFQLAGITVVSSKDFSNRILRSVEGAISQDGMEQTIQRMKDGLRLKAESGRITAKGRAAYGYTFVDSQGNPLGRFGKKDCHYAINEEEAEVVRYMFEGIASGRLSTHSISKELHEKLGRPPWNRWVCDIIRNPVYKGEFIANRSHAVKLKKIDTKADAYVLHPVSYTVRQIPTPRESWIVVTVPAIVEPELWELANERLSRNLKWSPRNRKAMYLLQGIMTCSECGKTIACLQRPRKFDNVVLYKCPTRHDEPNRCTQRSVTIEHLEDKVWEIVSETLSNPQVIIDNLDELLISESNRLVNDEVNFLENELRGRNKEYEKLYNLYQKDMISDSEFYERKQALYANNAQLEEEIVDLRTKIVTEKEIGSRKRQVMKISEQVVSSGMVLNATFEEKRRILHTCVDHIEINLREKWFMIYGLINGVWNFTGGSAMATNDDDGDDGDGDGSDDDLRTPHEG